MKYIFRYSLLLLFPAYLTAQDNDQQMRTRLMELVKERKARFEEFDKAIETKSGIFGNQTKKDLKAANEVLREIVKTDNRIIFELQRLLDQKSFEKTAETYKESSETRKRESYLQAIDNLNKTKRELEQKNKDLSKQLERSSLIHWILGILLLVVTFLFLRTRFKKQQAF